MADDYRMMRVLSRPAGIRNPRKREMLPWICVQAGHREQYGVPRALEHVGALHSLVTDVWLDPKSGSAQMAFGRLGRRLRDRYHSDIPSDKVHSFPWRSFAWELNTLLRRKRSGERVLARNLWWGKTAGEALRQLRPQTGQCLFSYAYEAHALFSAGLKLGLRPVLGQIDPGPVEDRKVAAVVQHWSQYETSFIPGSEEYYLRWREECQMASHIAVNSEWSRRALLEQGIPDAKIGVYPLVYTPPRESVGWKKSYPRAFSAQRPLRVLFLGQCILRKGIAETIEAARALVNDPVEFTFVGNTDIADFESQFGSARIRYYPRVSRAECAAFYRDADVFLFPTHSDGFGLTQLEAQAWKLPIIASSNCAEVVQPERTGYILSEVSSEAIGAALKRLISTPSTLAGYSAMIRRWDFDLEKLGQRLLENTRGESREHTTPTR